MTPCTRTSGRRRNAYAAYNFVSAKSLEIDLNSQNFTDGELVLGSLDAPRSKAFDAESRGPYNAAHIALKRDGAAAQATAMIDRDVIGFQQLGGRPLPILPLAILTDPAPPGLGQASVWAQKDPSSWEYQILARKGTDAWTAGPGVPRPGGDQIAEMRLVLSAQGHSANDNSQLTAVGASTLRDACRQVVGGVTAADLQTRGGRLLLDDGLARRPPDNRLVLPQLAVTEADLDGAGGALRGIIGMPRIWMLYENQSDSSGQTVLVCGFVAARVMNVQVAGSSKDHSSGPQLVVTVQPCRMTTPLALTERGRRDLGPRTLLNPYLGRVRLVE